MNYIENIIFKYDKIKIIIDKSILLTNNYDISNSDILKAYIITINDLFNEIDKSIDKREYTSFSTKYNLTWYSSNSIHHIKTIKVNDLNSLNDSIISGLYISNSNNINIKTYIKQNINLPFSFEHNYISNIGEKTVTSAFNIYGDAIFYIYMNIKSLLEFVNSSEILLANKVKIFNSFMILLIDYYNKYLDKLKRYYDLEILRRS